MRTGALQFYTVSHEQYKSQDFFRSSQDYLLFIEANSSIFWEIIMRPSLETAKLRITTVRPL